MNYIEGMAVIALLVNGLAAMAIYYVLRGGFASVNPQILLVVAVLGAFLVYAHAIPVLLLTWKYDLPKKAVVKYILNFGLPYDVGKQRVLWKDIGGFDETWIANEKIEHLHPVEHFDFIYSTRQVPGVKPEHVCIISQATGSIFVDLLKAEATARCHYLVKNAVSLGFVQDVVAGDITEANARDEYAKRILNNLYPSWFTDPLNEAETTVGEGGHHLVTSAE